VIKIKWIHVKAEALILDIRKNLLQRLIIQNWKFWVDYKKKAKKGIQIMHELKQKIGKKSCLRKWKKIIYHEKNFEILYEKRCQHLQGK
jgi:hypothetical protein